MIDASPDELRTLVRLLWPLRGRSFPRPDNGQPVKVDSVIAAIRAVACESDDSIDALMEKASPTGPRAAWGINSTASLQPERLGGLSDPAADAEFERVDGADEIRRVLAGLSDKEAAVLDLRFGITSGVPLTQAQVGERLGFSQQWVTKLEHRALRNARRQLQPAPMQDQEPEQEQEQERGQEQAA